jgi:hypothetical protein
MLCSPHLQNERRNILGARSGPAEYIILAGILHLGINIFIK